MNHCITFCCRLLLTATLALCSVFLIDTTAHANSQTTDLIFKDGFDDLIFKDGFDGISTGDLIFANGFDDLIFKDGFDGISTSDLIFANGFESPNSPPEAFDQAIQLYENQSIDITLTGSDPDGDALSYAIDASPNNGVLTGTVPNLTYAPNTNFNGIDSFTYHVNDGTTDSAVATVSIVVQEINAAPLIVTEPVKFVNEGSSYTYDVDANDPNNDIISYSLKMAPTGTAIDSLSGVISVAKIDAPTQGNRSQNLYCRSNALLQNSIEVIETILWPLNGDAYDDIDVPPLVIRAVDSNSDGQIDTSDAPVVVFNAYRGSYSANKVVGVRADTVETVFINDTSNIYPSGPMAAADIDGDGLFEIIASSYNRDEVVVLEHDGTEKFRAPINSNPYGSGWSYPPSVADIDQDGSPEILIAGSVLDRNGNTLWTHPVPRRVAGGPIVADLDLDGVNELIINGSIYSINGNLIWKLPISIPKRGGVSSAVANLDQDNDAEIITVVSGSVYAYSHLGEELWSTRHPGSGYGGAPTVGQVNGQTVIGVAGGTAYALFDSSGNVLWTQPTRDASSSITGSSMFDFNGDGRVEVVYADELYFRIYDAISGSVLLESPNRSHTGVEYSVIADVTLDGSANILVPENGGTRALRMFSGVTPWVNTRSIWNQHAYHIDNIGDNGAVPANPLTGWQNHNTFRLNAFPDRTPLDKADLAIFDLELTDTGSTTTVSVLVVNRGLVPSNAETLVRLYDSNPATGGQLLGSIEVPVLAVNQSLYLSLNNIETSAITTSVYAVIDENNLVDECITENNLAAATLFEVKATDDQGLYDTQRFLVNVADVNSPPTILTASIPNATVNEPYQARIEAIDSDLGDALLYELSQASYGMSILDTTGEIFWIPDATQQGSHDITVKVTDLAGEQISKTYEIKVLSTANNSPQITSQPVTDAKILASYEYQVTGTDQDGDVLSYGLTVSPSAMKINRNTGLITWTPNPQDAGTTNVKIRVTDGRGGEAIQAFDINVIGYESPVITSTPNSTVTEKLMFRYDIDATDSDNDLDSFAVLQSPGVHDLNADTGVFSAVMDSIPALPITTHNQFCRLSNVKSGRFDSAEKSSPLKQPDLAVTDLKLIEDQSSSRILVSVTNRGLWRSKPTDLHLTNGSPQPTGQLLASLSVPALTPDESLTLTHTLTDPSQVNTNISATIDVLDNNFECLENNNSLTAGLFEVQAIDAQNLTTNQRFTVLVENVNEPPSLNNAVLPNAKAVTIFRYVLSADDPDVGDAIRFNLLNAPDGVQLNPFNGQLYWEPTVTQVGQHTIEVEAVDLGGLSSTGQFSIVVEESTINQEPFISSTTVGLAFVGNAYQYNVVATDPDNNPITYALTQAPTGMSIHPDTGMIYWIPESTQTGVHAVTVEVTDGLGATVQQSFSVQVFANGTTPNNTPPKINSSPSFVASVNDEYQYQIIAIDADGDTLNYSLITAPTGMSVDANGLLTWTPDSEGSLAATVRVTDGTGYVEQSWSINVFEEAPDNQSPIITSLPTLTTAVNVLYSYDVKANDPDQDPLQFTLIAAPAGMQINASTGVLVWVPTGDQVGVYNVMIAVNDARGGSTSQSFTLAVQGGGSSNPPRLTGTPGNVAKIGRVYNYQVVASDIDGDVLNYQLITGPAGMSINNTGLLQWTPNNTGSENIVIRVDDGQYYVDQGWSVVVLEANVSLAANIHISPQQIIEGSEVIIQVEVLNAINPITVEMSIDGNPIVLNDQYTATISDSGLGSHNVLVQVTDAYETVTEMASYTVLDPNASALPEVDILSPEDGATITGFNDIKVRVQDDNLASWRLSYRYAEDDPSTTPRITLAQGTANVNDAVVAAWDTSLLRNGIYILVIEAVDDNGQASSIAHSLFLEGDLKLGHFAIAFEDLSIPVAGIPITITRGYDTRDRNRDRAFGKGWSIGFQSIRLQESRIPGLSWYQQIEYFYPMGSPRPFPRYCIYPGGKPLVSVTMPDGSLEKFLVKARLDNPSSAEKSDCQDYVPPRLFGIEFIAQGDTTSALTSNTGKSGLSVQGGNLVAIAETAPIDPNRYTLTTIDGTQYGLDQGFNVRTIKTTTGHSLSFTENGIEHSGGLTVSFIRDAQGRITRIQKADGQGIDYAYDSNGDLTGFTDLNGNTTTYSYINDHYLEQITDPRGIAVARNEYDAAGRLIAHIDANGNRIEYANDPVNMTSTITDRRGNATINAFDNAGNIIAQTNALGQTTHYQYNNLRLETARTNPLGHKTEWTYDSMGNQLTETDPLGNTTASTYNSKGELLTQTDALGQTTIDNQYLPDSHANGAGQLSTVTDALGHSTQFHWLTDSNGTTANTGYTDALGNRYDINPIPGTANTGYTDALGNRYDINPISGTTNSGLTGTTTDLNGLKTETTYDDQARPLTETQIITDAGGATIAQYTTTYQYNANGDITTTTDPLGHSTHTEYNALNKVSATIDANGNRTETEYDNRGNPSLTRYADGSTETKTYDAENNLIAQTDRAGRTTKTTYDALNRIIAVIYPDNTPGDDTDNPTTINSYDAAGRLVGVSDANGNTTVYEYDDAGRRTKTTDPLGNETTGVYDALGRRTQSTDANGRITTFEYNALGSLVTTHFANGTHTTTSYDKLGRKTAETDLAGLSTQYEYNAAGNLTAVIDALNQRTEYSYDQRGNKLTQKDANGHTTTWSYDALNRVTSRTLPMGEVETYTYDAVGNRISKTDFNGDTTTYAYNNLNQLITTTYADGNTVTYTYTATGQIQSVTQSSSTTGYSYDAQDRLIRIDYPNGQSIDYQYDLNGNRTQVKTPSQTVNYSYDPLNRLKTVTDAQGTTTYNYDAVGNRAGQTNANGTIATYTYDPLNRLTNLTHTNTSNQTIASYAYELAPNGNRLSITEATGRVVEYSYDNLYRLLTETITDTVNGNHASEWSYDPVGNRTQQQIDGLVTTYSYNNNDHLLSETETGTTTTYAYDANGNTLTKSINGTVDTSYSYSKDNRMLTANTGTSNISYTYDAGGIRQSQTVDGLTTNYLIDPNRSYPQVIEEQDNLFLPQVTYTYGDDLINQTRTGQTTTYGYDGLGSTRILTDSTGTVQNAYGYQAFGELDYQFGTVENSYLFTGEQYDNNVGFYYLRARYYNPEIGRFSQMDTFPGMQFEPLSLHKYLYTHADPVNNVDPSGNITLGGLMARLRSAAIRAMYATANSLRIFGRHGVKLADKLWLNITRQVGKSRIPKSWGKGKSNKKGLGWRWLSDKNGSNTVRIDKGNKKAHWPSQKVDHVRVNYKNDVIGRNGKILDSSKNAEAHIPLREWLNWKNWYSP